VKPALHPLCFSLWPFTDYAPRPRRAGRLRRSCLRAWRRFRCSTLRPASWGRCWRAGFIGLGMTYAFACARGETIYIRAYEQTEVSNIVLDLLRADAAFPLSAQIREANAGFLSRLVGLPPKVALVPIRRALREAPDSPPLLYALTLKLIEDGDRAQAAETLDHLRRVAPSWPMTKEAESILGGK